MTATTDTAEKSTALDFFYDLEPTAGDFLTDAIEGLSQTQKTLPPKHFYDQHGSQLFDAICGTEEYYVTRTEIALLDEIGLELAERAGPDALVIEFGSGSSIKIRNLLSALERPKSYVAIDISRDHLLDAARRLATDYPSLAVGAICADFTQPLALPTKLGKQTGRRLGFLPGSTIGNFTPREAERFLSDIHDFLGPGAALLIGVDLKKEKTVVSAAYNDQEGHTAAFNLNLLARMNRELGTDLDLEKFEHHAFYNEDKGRVEMHLKSRADQQFDLAEHKVSLSRGETIHTENSHKYTLAEFAGLSAKAGFNPQKAWTDEENLFSIHWLATQS